MCFVDNALLHGSSIDKDALVAAVLQCGFCDVVYFGRKSKRMLSSPWHLPVAWLTSIAGLSVHSYLSHDTQELPF